MEHPTHNFRETNIVLQLIQESEITIKPVMSWSSQKKKEGIFFQNVHNFTYQKILLHALFLLVFKTVHQSRQCILKEHKIHTIF